MTEILAEDSYLDKKEVVQRLIKESQVSTDFYFLLTISTLITTLGLLINNSAVIIGGMLIAPLLSPLLALGLGLVTTNRSSLLRSGTAIIKSIGTVLLLSTLIAFLIGVDDPQNQEIIQRIKPSLPFMYIAILSGIGATFAWVKPKLSATLPGIAIVVSLLPPLCTTGIGLSIFDREIITGSFQLFLVNFIGIVLSSAVLFSLFGFHQMQLVEVKEIADEQEQLAEKKYS